MIEHIVLIKLNPQVTQEQKAELIDKTYQLKNSIPGIIDLQQGENFSPRSQSYNIGLTVRFEDRAALDFYLPHPEHQKILGYLQEIGLEDLIVVDFEI